MSKHPHCLHNLKCIEKYDKKNGSYKSCINPDCDYLHSVTAAVEEAQKEAFAKENEIEKLSKQSLEA